MFPDKNGTNPGFNKNYGKIYYFTNEFMQIKLMFKVISICWNISVWTSAQRFTHIKLISLADDKSNILEFTAKQNFIVQKNFYNSCFLYLMRWNTDAIKTIICFISQWKCVVVYLLFIRRLHFVMCAPYVNRYK